MTKDFISISSVIYNNKLVMLNTSCGTSLFNENGITFDKAIEFLFNLIYKRSRKHGVVFVCYAFSRDNEFIFSTMPKALKDKLFVSHNVKKDIDELENELEEIETNYYNLEQDTQDFEQVDFEKYVVNLSLKELTEVKHNGYKITLRNGKILTINKKGKSLSIYDIYGFFDKKTLRQSVNIWLNKDIPLLDKNIFTANPLFKNNEIEQLKIYANLETKYIKELATKLNSELEKQNINLSRYHGATAVTSHFLGKVKARKFYHNYRYKRQLAPELHKAVNSAFFGGRAEQFKIGTVKDVNVYDINSAYAFATCFLPVMLSKPYFVSEWQDKPFSLFFCEYNFTSNDNYFGYLPNREINGQTKYKLKGKGWFWQPEVSYIIENFPECINVKYGYALDYKSIPFAKDIENLYNLRLELQAANNPLEKVIKFALASIYGKFAQWQGKGHYFNRFYAGYVTSLTRRMLLEATKGYEQETICFQTDAIHTTANLPVNIDSALGNFKQNSFRHITYLDNGIYKAVKNNGECKTKSRGFKSFDFEKALSELQTNLAYSANVSMFVGHNLSSMRKFWKHPYLSLFNENKTTNPYKENMRIFENKAVDLLRDYLDSAPVIETNEFESAMYRQTSYENKNIIDSLEAMRI